MRSRPTAGATQVDVGIKVGPVQKVATVFGDRFWVWTRQGVGMSRTAPLERVPLTWENAFGGHDETAIDTGARRCSSRAIRSAPDSARRWRRTATISGCPTSKIPNRVDRASTATSSHRAASGSRRRTGNLAPGLPGRTTTNGTRPGNRCCRSISIDGSSMPRHRVSSRPDTCEATRTWWCSTPRRFLDWRFVCQVFLRRCAGSSCAAGRRRRLSDQSRHGHRQHRRTAADSALASLRA